MYVVNKYWFGIVRVEHDRYTWIFVKTGNGKLRVLARSDRDYRSKTKAGQAIEKLQDVVADAEIYQATGSFALPNTSFEVDHDVVPLMVGQARHDRGKRKKTRTQPQPASQ